MVTKSKEIDISLKVLHHNQRLIANSPARYSVVACGRRFGKTEVAKDILVNRAIAGQRCWWCAPVYPESTEVWRSIVATFKPMSPWMEIRQADREIYLPNGGYIGVRSTMNYQNLRGIGLDFAVLDEAAFHHKDVWPQVIRPMLLERRGSALFPSTPYGRNWFWDIFTLGHDDEEPDWKSWHFTSYDSPLISHEELADIKRTTPSRIFEEEYLADFKSDGGAVFRGVDKVCTAQKREPYEGNFVFGIDWGKNVDFTVVSVYDADTLTEVDIDRYNQVEWQLQRNRITTMFNKWKPSVILAEWNSIGDVNIEALQAGGLPVRPFMTTGRSKPQLIESFSLAIEQEEVTLLDDPLAKLELLSYQLTRLKNGGYGYDAPPGKHDDTVIARALAYHQASIPKVASIAYLD